MRASLPPELGWLQAQALLRPKTPHRRPIHGVGAMTARTSSARTRASRPRTWFECTARLGFATRLGDCARPKPSSAASCIGKPMVARWREPHSTLKSSLLGRVHQLPQRSRPERAGRLCAYGSVRCLGPCVSAEYAGRGGTPLLKSPSRLTRIGQFGRGQGERTTRSTPCPPLRPTPRPGRSRRLAIATAGQMAPNHNSTAYLVSVRTLM